MFRNIFGAAQRQYPVLEVRSAQTPTPTIAPMVVDLTEDTPPASPTESPPASPVYAAAPASPASQPSTPADQVLRINAQSHASLELVDLDNGTYELRGTHTAIAVDDEGVLMCTRQKGTHAVHELRSAPSRLRLCAYGALVRLCPLPQCRLNGILHESAVLVASELDSVNLQLFGSSKFDGSEVSRVIRLVDRSGLVQADVKYVDSTTTRRFLYQCASLPDAEQLCVGDKCPSAAHHRKTACFIARPIAAAHDLEAAPRKPKRLRVRVVRRSNNEALDDVLVELNRKTAEIQEVLATRSDNFLLDYDDQDLLNEPARPADLDYNERRRFNLAHERYEAAVQSLRERQAEQLGTRHDALSTVVNIHALPEQLHVRSGRQWDQLLATPRTAADPLDPKWPRVPQCVVCAAPADTVFECGHACLCLSDYEQLIRNTQRDVVRPCLVCRQPVERVIKLFF